MNISSGQTTHFNRQHGLTDLSCYALFRDSQGTLWAGSMSGMNVFNAASSQFQPVKSFGALTLDIDEDRHGNLWFSTQGSGVWCYQRASRSWKNYRHQAGDTLSLASDQISCICITADHRLWAATESGLCLYDEAHDTFTPVHLDIPSSDIRGIVEDGQYLWLTTTKGIVRYNQERDASTPRRRQSSSLPCASTTKPSPWATSRCRRAFPTCRSSTSRIATTCSACRLPP